MTSDRRLEALGLIAQAADVEVVRVFDHLQARVDGLVADRERLAEGLPEDLRVIDGVDVVEGLREATDRELPAGASAAVARRLLTIAADDPALAGLLVEAFAAAGGRRDEEMTGTLLAVGAIGVVWMVVASLDVAWKDGRFAVTKHPLSGDQLRGLADIVRAILGVPGAKPWDDSQGPDRI